MYSSWIANEPVKNAYYVSLFTIFSYFCSSQNIHLVDERRKVRCSIIIVFKDNLSVLVGTLSRKIFKQKIKIRSSSTLFIFSKTFLLPVLIQYFYKLFLHITCILLTQTQRLFSTSYHEDSKQLTQQDRVTCTYEHLWWIVGSFFNYVDQIFPLLTTYLPPGDWGGNSYKYWSR